jgi:hypothetical protein
MPPPGQPPFLIADGEFTAQHFDVKTVFDELHKSDRGVLYLNCLEAFAIPFAAGLADEEIGYRETARPFCQGMNEVMPVLFVLR